MVVKVASTCLQWSQSIIPRSTPSSQALASSIASPSSKRHNRGGGGGDGGGQLCLYVHSLNRSALFGTPSTKLSRSQSCGYQKRRFRSIRRACSASLDAFSDEEFSKKIQELALRLQLSDNFDGEDDFNVGRNASDSEPEAANSVDNHGIRESATRMRFEQNQSRFQLPLDLEPLWLTDWQRRSDSRGGTTPTPRNSTSAGRPSKKSRTIFAGSADSSLPAASTSSISFPQPPATSWVSKEVFDIFLSLFRDATEKKPSSSMFEQVEKKNPSCPTMVPKPADDARTVSNKTTTVTDEQAAAFPSLHNAAATDDDVSKLKYPSHQHMGERYLFRDLLKPESERVGSPVERVLDPEEADLFHVPFFSSLSLIVNPARPASRSEKPLYSNEENQVALIKWLESQEYWKRNNGRDHVIMASDPNALYKVIDKVKKLCTACLRFWTVEGGPRIACEGRDRALHSPHQHLHGRQMGTHCYLCSVAVLLACAQW